MLNEIEMNLLRLILEYVASLMFYAYYLYVSGVKCINFELTRAYY